MNMFMAKGHRISVYDLDSCVVLFADPPSHVVLCHDVSFMQLVRYKLIEIGVVVGKLPFWQGRYHRLDTA